MSSKLINLDKHVLVDRGVWAKIQEHLRSSAPLHRVQALAFNAYKEGRSDGMRAAFGDGGSMAKKNFAFCWDTSSAKLDLEKLVQENSK